MWELPRRFSFLVFIRKILFIAISNFQFEKKVFFTIKSGFWSYLLRFSDQQVPVLLCSAIFALFTFNRTNIYLLFACLFFFFKWNTFYFYFPVFSSTFNVRLQCSIICFPEQMENSKTVKMQEKVYEQIISE